jgi:hypothetical protein
MCTIECIVRTQTPSIDLSALQIAGKTVLGSKGLREQMGYRRNP